MTIRRAHTLSFEWKELLGIAGRRSPELYESSESVVGVPHALVIRTILDDLGLSAVFCIQGVPTIAILSLEQYDREHIVDLHGILWNQGLLSLLLVISGDTLRAFSLSRTPYKDSGDKFDKRCLIDTLKCTADALEFRNLIYGAESGRLWREYHEYFQTKERIDQVFLDNLNESHRLLCQADLTSDAAQALLIQAMFIAYLEDREIITPEYFQLSVGNDIGSFSSLLSTGNVKHLSTLFKSLWNDFNGDLFVAPCSFEPQKKAPKIRTEHLAILERFRSGREEMRKGGGQLRFWGYNFRYIPIELVSAVYDRFLAEHKKRKEGAYYTPMFLADTVVSQVWDQLSDEVRDRGRYLDPACGSGVFLVRLFQRLCEYWRSNHESQTIRWDSLLAILNRVHGWDINGGAVRVAVFSLYVALLEEVSPPDIRRLISHRKILPELWNHTLICQDFFEVPADVDNFQVIIGNPPWTSRRGSDRSSVNWCEKNSLPMPSGEDAWAFAWKAACHIEDCGVVALLLPAMGFLHNHAKNTVEARNKFIIKNSIKRVINFADLRFQLFENAHRPATLIIYGKSGVEKSSYSFDYWTPKADLNLQLKRHITLSSTDKLTLNAKTAIEQPLCFKQRLWMRETDGKLFSYLSRLPRLGSFIRGFGNLSRRTDNIDGQWIIGQGFQPYNKKGTSTSSQYVGILPYLPINAFERISQSIYGLQPFQISPIVRRKGFEMGFEGVRILVPRGVETSKTRLRATYTEDSLTFQHIIQAITVPKSEKFRAKLLTAYLNSRIALWYAFHGTASFGSDRPEVQQAELLKLPFPSPEDLPDPEQAEDAAKKLVAIVNKAIQKKKNPSILNSSSRATLRKIDQLVYQYFCLTNEEIILIEDAAERIIPAVQPHEGSYPDLWKMPKKEDREAYTMTLVSSLSKWLQEGTKISGQLEASSSDLGILGLTVNGGPSLYTESRNTSFTDVLNKISKDILQPLNGNFFLVPDLRVFVGNNLYLIKPMQQRFWMRATALADADAIAMDLNDAITLERQRGQT